MGILTRILVKRRKGEASLPNVLSQVAEHLLSNSCSYQTSLLIKHVQGKLAPRLQQHILPVTFSQWPPSVLNLCIVLSFPIWFLGSSLSCVISSLYDISCVGITEVFAVFLKRLLMDKTAMDKIFGDPAMSFTM